MDASPDVLADTVRMQRIAVDNDLELLRVRLQRADPRRRVDAEMMKRWARTAVPVAAGAVGLWAWARRRRSVRSLDDLLARGLHELYGTERLLVPALQRMASEASNPELRTAFETHASETEGQLDRLTRVFRSIGIRPKKRDGSIGVEGLIAEGESLLKRRVDPDVRDAWLVAAAQRIEHFEIATYGTVRTYAETLGYTQAAQLLQQTLEEERAADEKLSLLAMRFINPQSIRSARPA
jgi:ferritin-like metal-binding protein YciE